ncbi:MAG: hypothetical protein WC144_01365, partial [Sulfurimonas sp.]
DHIEFFKHFYNPSVKPNEFGFVKMRDDKFTLLHEDLKCDLINGKTDELIKQTLVDELMGGAKYILTSSKYVIFPKKFSFKRVASRVFEGYVIQGAGEVEFYKDDSKIKVRCFGEAPTIGVKSREIDSLILQDELQCE